MAEENRLDKLEKELGQLQKSIADMEKNLSDLAEKSLDKAQDVTKENSAKARELANVASENAQDLWHSAKACPYANEMADCVKKHPVASAAVVGGIAAIIGTWVVKCHH